MPYKAQNSLLTTIKYIFEQLMFLKAKYLATELMLMLINGVMSIMQGKSWVYFDNSCLVETKKGNHDRMKAADTYYSIHPYMYTSLHHSKMFA